MLRVFALLLAILGCATAADILAVNPANNNVIVAGSLPATAPQSGELVLGGGRVSADVGFDIYLNAVLQGTIASDATGPFVQWRQPNKVFTIFDDVGWPQVVVTKNPPTTVSASQVAIGGGYIWAGASQFNMRPSADMPIEVVNRPPAGGNGGIDLYPDGIVKAVQVTKTGTTFSVPVTASNVTINRTTPAAATEAVRGDDPRVAGGGIRAWVNFDGTTAGTAMTIRASYNVASVQRVSTGVFRITFANAMSSAHYAPIITCGPQAMTSYFDQAGALTTTTVSFVCINGTMTVTNPSIVTVAIMGN